MTLIFILQAAPINNLTLLIPLLVVAFASVFKVIHDEIIRKRNIREILENNLIASCDKIVRYAIEYEQLTLAMRLFERVMQILPGDEVYKNMYYHYHKEGDKSREKFGEAKAELKIYVREIRRYWRNELEGRLILKIMSKAVLIDLRGFTHTFSPTTVTTFAQATQIYNALKDNVEMYVIFNENSIGIHFFKIQDMVDPKMPSLYLNEELEKDMRKVLDCYDCESNCKPQITTQ